MVDQAPKPATTAKAGATAAAMSFVNVSDRLDRVDQAITNASGAATQLQSSALADLKSELSLMGAQSQSTTMTPAEQEAVRSRVEGLGKKLDALSSSAKK